MAGLSINEMTTYRWSFEEDLKHYKEAGIDAVGVWRQKMADCGEERALSLLHQSGLRVSNVLWAGGFTGSDGHTYEESVADARDAIALSSSLEAGCLVVYSGGRNGHTQNHARRLFASALRDLLPVAEDLGVVLAIEPMHPGCADEWTFLTGLDETLDLIEGLGSSQLKLVFDTYQLGHESGILDRIGDLARHTAIVHLGDASAPPEHEQNRCSLGEGNLPLGDMVAAIQKAGYDGYYDVELMGEAVECIDYCELLERSKCAFRQLVC
ncbi:MAG: sugar phosphate isomerase/epimerase [Planctomycetota bacterium]|nr:MAG: sugar phosphate isomerase/epimerase [Planctomycetota bacterium]